MSSDVLEPFLETAQDLIDRFGIEESLCRALAIISGHTKKIQQRSLLWAVEGYITVIMRVKTEISSISYIWSILRRSFSQSLVDGVKGVKMLKDKHGAAFDIPESLKSEIIEAMVTGGNSKPFTVEFPTELPELAEDDRSRMMGNGNSMNQRGGYGNNQGGYGGRRDGYSGGYGNRDQNMGGGGGSQRRNYGEKMSHNKLFVGNLGYNTEDVSLRDAFESHGLGVVDAFIIKGIQM